MKRNIKGWKRACEEAISFVHYPQQRERVAMEVAERLINRTAEGSRLPATAAKSALRAGIESQISLLLSVADVRLSLAARYLDVLDDSISLSDYEDAKAIAVEARWAEEHLQTLFECPFLTAPEAGTPAATLAGTAYRSNQLYSALAMLLGPRLRISYRSAA